MTLEYHQLPHGSSTHPLTGSRNPNPDLVPCTQEGEVVPDMQRALLATLRGDAVHAQTRTEAATGTTGLAHAAARGSLAPCVPWLVEAGHALMPQSCRLLRFYRCLVRARMMGVSGLALVFGLVIVRWYRRRVVGSPV
jgi:hypothetical protein